VKTNKLKTRYDFPGASKVAGINSDEIEVSGDKRAIEKLLKLKGEKLSDYKMDSRTKSYIYDEVDLKDKKKEEVKKEGKTATGEKPTKVELDPKIK
jgi:hypothetical protein